MATDVERLVVSLEASITKYERAMQRAVGQTTQTARQIERRFEQTAKTLDQRFSAAGSAMSMGLAKAFAGVAALRGAQQLIDTSTRIENSLKVAGLAGENLARVYDSLFASAQRNAAPLESLVTLYGRAAIVQKELGVSTQELLSFTDNVAVALRVAGTDASTASGALLQLSQALGAGTVRAEEFNSILEGALPIAQAAAAGLEEAGGSVAKLRALVVEGKVSSEAFFRAFEAGSTILTDKVANAELTVSQGFVRLQNVLVDAAGKFNEATGASREFGSMLTDIAGLIETVGNAFADNEGAVQKFIDVLDGSWSYEAGQSIRENLIDTLHSIRMGPLTDDALHMQEALEGATSMLDEWRAGWGETLPPELAASVDDLIVKVKAGGEEAVSAQQALLELGQVSTPFTEAFGHLSDLVAQLQRVRAEAGATAAAVAGAANATPAADGIALQRSEQRLMAAPEVKDKISIEDPRYRVSPVRASGGGGGGKSSADRFADAIVNQERRIAALQRETELQRGLNPLVNDYGFSLEKLRAQMELENAAKEAGLPLDEKRQEQIEGLATGYASATAEAGRLAEAQSKAKESADALAQAGEQAMNTIVDGLLEGKDAGETLDNVLKDLTRSLIDIGINMVKSNLTGLLGGLFGGGFGTIGQAGVAMPSRGFVPGLTGPKLFARGGVAREASIFGEAGPEAAVPLPDGRRIPVDLRMPALPSPSAQQSLEVHIVSDDDKFGAYVTTKAGQVVAATAPGIVDQGASKAGSKLAGGDFDRSMGRFGVSPQAKRR